MLIAARRSNLVNIRYICILLVTPTSHHFLWWFLSFEQYLIWMCLLNCLRSDNQLVDPSAVVTSTVQVEETSVAPAASSSGDASFVTDTDQSNSSYSIIQDQNNNANTAACNNISSSLNHEEDFPPPPSEEELKQNGSGNKIQRLNFCLRHTDLFS